MGERLKGITKKQFMEKTGLSRQRLNQLMYGYRQKKNGREYYLRPILEEGKDFEKSEVVFFPSAVKKIKNKGETK